MIEDGVIDVATGDSVRLQVDKDVITSCEMGAGEHLAIFRNRFAPAGMDIDAALAAGERGGELSWWEVPEDIVAFSRTKGENQVIVIANFGKEAYTPEFKMAGTVYTNHFTGEKVEGPANLSIAPGAYLVLTK